MKNRGLSTIVATMLIILLTVAVVGVVWVTVKNIIEPNLEKSESCFGIQEQISISKNRFTCYDSTNKELKYLISVRDVNLEKIIVSITHDGKKVSRTIEQTEVPSKNSGKTYSIKVGNLFTDTNTNDYSIEIAPVVNGNSCGVVDSMLEVPDCSEFS